MLSATGNEGKKKAPSHSPLKEATKSNDEPFLEKTASHYQHFTMVPGLDT